jgi:hypothetical protein
MAVPLVVKLKAIALDVGKRLRKATDLSSQREDGDAEVGAGPLRATNPSPRGSAPLTGVVPKVELAPQATAQQRQFARQCTLQAVFDWYQVFLEREPVEGPTSDDGSGKRSGETSMRPGVPGFPQFARQVIETEPDRVRVRFFDAGGSEAGVLLLRSEADRCVIEVPGGAMYVTSHTTSLPDFTHDQESGSAATSRTTSAEKQRPATSPSPVPDAG